MKRMALVGNHALSYGAMLSRVQVIAAYPITPQTQVVELLSEMCADGTLNAEFVKVESEHSAMAAVMGASASGARTFTATSSQGLALMHEVLHWVTGARLPVVMGNINRAFGPPWSIWTEQTDSLSQRDTGWMQIYAQDNQEVLDSVILAYKVSEQILLPTMVVLDAFFLSHTSEPVEIPDQEMVDEFLPPYKNKYILDPDDPHAFGGLTNPEWYMELRFMIHQAHEQALNLIEKEGKEFKKLFGRYYGLVDAYKVDDAETILVAVSTVASTARYAVDLLRKQGKKVGLLRIRVFRPFPYQKVKDILSNAKRVIVLDRNLSPGAGGIIASEVRGALANVRNHPPVFSYIMGLGGRDITAKHVMELFEEVEGKDEGEDIIWKGVKL